NDGIQREAGVIQCSSMLCKHHLVRLGQTDRGSARQPVVSENCKKLGSGRDHSFLIEVGTGLVACRDGNRGIIDDIKWSYIFHPGYFFTNGVAEWHWDAGCIQHIWLFAYNGHYSINAIPVLMEAIIREIV